MAKGAKTGGRQKGTPNKMTAELKEMVLQALDESHPDGGVEYLKDCARNNPTAFLTLVGKVLPLTVAGDDKSPLQIQGKVIWEVFGLPAEGSAKTS